MKKAELIAIKARHDSVPVTLSGAINWVSDDYLGGLAQSAHNDRGLLINEVVRLRDGLSSIVNCQSKLTRAHVREACYEVLHGEVTHMPDQSPIYEALVAERIRR